MDICDSIGEVLFVLHVDVDNDFSVIDALIGLLTLHLLLSKCIVCEDR